MDAAVKAYRATTNQASRDDLIVDHIGDVKNILGRVVAALPDSVDRDNLEAAGLLGLVEAAHHFRPELNVKFSAFAYHRIRGAILDELRRNCPLSQRMLERWSTIRKAIESHDGYASVEQLADSTQLSAKDISDCMEAIRLTRPEEWNEEFGFRVNPMLSDIEQEEKQQQLEDAIMQLEERDRSVVIMYYRDELRLKEIGEVLGLSESRVSRILSEAVRKMRVLVGSEESPDHKSQ
ncbi:MAG: sigma-70 family RNA polymerase sigma factor [Fuerstiella sp.]